MKLTNKDWLAFANASFNTFDLSNFDIDKSVALNSLMEELSDEFEDLNTSATKQARLDHFKIQGAILEDYSERVLVLSESKKVFFGIRHESGNVKYPFVQITPNFDLSREELIELYNDKMKDLFSIFKPLQIRFWSKRRVEFCEYRSTYLVSTHRGISKLNRWPQENNLSFESVKDDTYYEWYKAGYEKFHAENISLVNRVTLNSRDVMRDSMNDDLLKIVLLNGERIGLIAAERSDFLGHAGIYFNEIFIDEKFKGRGLAKAIQRKFVQEFSKHDDFIWGTIDHNNIPSYKTAISNNRKAVRIENIITLD